MELNMQKTFGEVELGGRFVVNGIEYTKVQDVRVSCCKSINAQETANAGNRTFFSKETIVNTNG
jgi:hypothetical protein